MEAKGMAAIGDGGTIGEKAAGELHAVLALAYSPSFHRRWRRRRASSYPVVARAEARPSASRPDSQARVHAIPNLAASNVIDLSSPSSPAAALS